MALGLLVIVPVGLLVVAAAVGLLVALTTSVPGGDLLATTAAARRRGVLGSTLAVSAAVLAVVLVLALAGRLGRSDGPLLATVPSLAGLVHLAVLAVTERTWPHPRGAVRSARLVRRGVASVTPAGARRVLAAALGLLVLTLAAGALLAAPDGRSIEVRTATTARGAGPFPGPGYGLPAAAAGLALVLATVMVLRLVVARPAVEGADAATDEALRRAGAHRAVRGTTAAVLLTVGPLLVAGGGSASHVHDGRAGALALAVLVLGLVTGLAGLVVLAVPAPRVPAPSDPADQDAPALTP